MPLDPDVSVYAVPVRLEVHAEMYVLARSLQDARVQAAKQDLNDLFCYDDEHVDVDDVARVMIKDIATPQIVDTGMKESEPTLQPDYLVEDHPSYDPAEHDVKDEPDEDEGIAEGLRS
jgi:hypothetical protein